MVHNTKDTLEKVIKEAGGTDPSDLSYIFGDFNIEEQVLESYMNLLKKYSGKK